MMPYWVYDLARRIIPGGSIGYLDVAPGDHLLLGVLGHWGPRVYRFKTRPGSTLKRWGGGFCGIEFGDRGGLQEWFDTNVLPKWRWVSYDEKVLRTQAAIRRQVSSSEDHSRS